MSVRYGFPLQRRLFSVFFYRRARTPPSLSFPGRTVLDFHSLGEDMAKSDSRLTNDPQARESGIS